MISVFLHHSEFIICRYDRPCKILFLIHDIGQTGNCAIRLKCFDIDRFFHKSLFCDPTSGCHKDQKGRKIHHPRSSKPAKQQIHSCICRQRPDDHDRICKKDTVSGSIHKFRKSQCSCRLHDTHNKCIYCHRQQHRSIIHPAK